MHLIVTTCGTSLLTNLASDDTNLRKLTIAHANTEEPDHLPADARERLDDLIAKADRELTEGDQARKRQLSAEMNGLLLLQRELPKQDQRIHWLVASDTWLGRGAAACVARALERLGEKAEIKSIRGLRTDALVPFRSGVTELARLCAEDIKGMRDGGRRIVFNLTGGFKAVQGFMQALGMLYADDIVYVFERTDTLLHIPRLPVELDALRIVREHQYVFRRLAADLPVTPEQVAGMPETLYERADDIILLSVWGEALWHEAKKTLLEEKLWAPVSDKLRFGEGLEKSVESACWHQPDRLRIVNERLLDLARYLEGDNRNLSRLDFKKLKGKHSRWTHECDAWSDRDARRLYGHFEDGVFVLDELGRHL